MSNLFKDGLYVGPAIDLKPGPAMNITDYSKMFKGLNETFGKAMTYDSWIATSLCFKPKRIISNDPATIIIWNDDTKTVVKCSKDDNYDLRTGILLCFMKKLFGNNNNYHKILYDAIDNAEVQFDDKEV